MAEDPFFDDEFGDIAGGADDAFDAAEKDLLKAADKQGGKPLTATQFDREVRNEGAPGGSEMQTIIREWPELKRMVEEIHEMMDKMGRLG